MKFIQRFIALKMSILRVDAAIIKRKKVKPNDWAKVVHTVRDYYLLCINGNLKSSRTNQVCKSPRFLCSFRQRLNIRFLRWVDVCTSPSKATSQIITESLKKPVITVYNAIDYDEEYVTNLAKKKINALRRKKNFSIVYIGALSSFKGVDWLLENFMKISGTNIELHIAGSGPFYCAWAYTQIFISKDIYTLL